MVTVMHTPLIFFMCVNIYLFCPHMFLRRDSCVFRRNEVIDKDAVIKRLQVTLGKLYLQVAFYEVNISHNLSSRTILAC